MKKRETAWGGRGVGSPPLGGRASASPVSSRRPDVAPGSARRSPKAGREGRAESLPTERSISPGSKPALGCYQLEAGAHREAAQEQPRGQGKGKGRGRGRSPPPRASQALNEPTPAAGEAVGVGRGERRGVEAPCRVLVTLLAGLRRTSSRTAKRVRQRAGGLRGLRGLRPKGSNRTPLPGQKAGCRLARRTSQKPIHLRPLPPEGRPEGKPASGRLRRHRQRRSASKPRAPPVRLRGLSCRAQTSTTWHGRLPPRRAAGRELNRRREKRRLRFV